MTQQLGGCPYKGLTAYTEDDKDVRFFFGRARDAELIISNLYSSKLTTLYGGSGVGKSSVLRAGVISQLRLRPDAGVVYQNTWQGDALGRLKASITDVARKFGAPDDQKNSVSLTATIQKCTDGIELDLMIILDQFEECLLYHGNEDGPGTFVYEFAEAINQAGLAASFVISMRDDALSKLDRFKRSIPGLLTNYLRLRHLSVVAARDAIEGPLQAYNRLLVGKSPDVSIEPKLVDRVIEDVRPDRVILGETGRGKVTASVESNAGVETAYLQLVMTHLWNEAVSDGSRKLQMGALDRIGGAKAVMRAHLDSAMKSLTHRERRTAAAIFLHLVTPSGTKIAQTVSDLTAYANASASQVDSILKKLSGGPDRILRPAPPPLGRPDAASYEIFHDVLSAAILDWRRRFTRHIENRKRWLAYLIAGVFAGVAVFARVESDRAKKFQAESQSRAWALSAIDQLETDPERSLLLALMALFSAPTSEASYALQQGLLTHRTKLTLPAPGRVYTVAYSPDGTPIATGGEKGVQLWSGTGQLLKNLTPSPGEVMRVAFSPNGHRLAVGGADGRLTVWDTNSKALIFGQAHPGAVWGVAFSPDGALLASAGEFGYVALWDAESGTPKKKLTTAHHELDGVSNLTFSPDSKKLAASFLRGVIVWNMETSAPLWEQTGGGTIGAGFSRDGKQLAVGTGSDVKIRDANSGRELETLPGGVGVGVINGLAFSPSPNGSSLATANTDTTVRIWDLQTDQVSMILRGHDEWVVGVAFSPDGNTLATAGLDGKAIVWDLSPPGAFRPYKAVDQPIDIAFQPDSRHLTILDSQTVTFWDPEAGDVTLAPKNPLSVSLAISSDGNLILGASSDDTTGIFNAASGQRLAVFSGVSHASGLALFSRDGTRAALADARDRIKIWDTSSGTELQTLSDLKDDRVLAFSPDGKWLLTGDDSGKATIWDVASKKRIILPTSRKSRESEHRPVGVTCAVFSKDSTRAATSNADLTVRIWDLTKSSNLAADVTILSPLMELKGAHHVQSIDLSPDGSRLVTSESEKGVIIWNTATGRKLFSFPGGAAQITRAIFSPDGQRVAAIANDKTVRVYTLNDKDLVRMAESRITRSLRPDECQNYLHGECPREAEAVALYVEAKQSAREGNTKHARELFATAAKKGLFVNAESELASIAAEGLVERGSDEAGSGHLQEAIQSYADAKKLDPQKISATSWNTLCWYGALYGYASQIMEACEQAVKLRPDIGEIHDSRGVARALTGNTQGSIEDFSAYLKDAPDGDPSKRQRQRWVDSLRTGKNPFTPEELKLLLKE